MDENTADVSIRRASVADLEGVVASSTGLFREDGATRDPLRNPEWPKLNAANYENGNLTNPDMLVLVADHDGAVVGHLTGAFYPASAMWTAPRAHLISMHVMPQWRGQNVGGRLVEQFKVWAKEKGAVQLRVTAYTANEGAMRFYQRQGFAPLESTFAFDF